MNNYNDGASTTDRTPTLNFDLDDPDAGDLIKYQIQIDNNSDFTSPEQDLTETGSTIAPRAGETYTASPLFDGQYYWRVKTIDDG